MTKLYRSNAYVELGPTLSNFLISADKRVLVAQYMLGQTYGGGRGDPAFTLAVPIQQYRQDYLFHAPTNYELNFVNITAPTGATVNLDSAPVTNFTAIGTTGYGIARVMLSNAGNGNHSISAAMPVGISVYGYGQYTSYWYPGGLNLEEL